MQWFTDRSVEVSLPSLLLVLAWVTFLLLYDEIFPAQVTGQDREGNDITLQVCSAPVKFEQIYRNNVNAVSRKTYLPHNNVSYPDNRAKVGPLHYLLLCKRAG